MSKDLKTKKITNFLTFLAKNGPFSSKKPLLALFGPEKTALFCSKMTLFWPFVGFPEFFDAKQGQMCEKCHNHAKYALLEFLNKISQK